jgi:hypothetical protein
MIAVFSKHGDDPLIENHNTGTLIAKREGHGNRTGIEVGWRLVHDLHSQVALSRFLNNRGDLLRPLSSMRSPSHVNTYLCKDFTHNILALPEKGRRNNRLSIDPIVDVIPAWLRTVSRAGRCTECRFQDHADYYAAASPFLSHLASWHAQRVEGDFAGGERIWRWNNDDVWIKQQLREVRDS